jgi:hypothetical protein
VNSPLPPRRALALAFAWAAASILLAVLLWLFTGNLRANRLAAESNRIIARTGDARRLGKLVGVSSGLGYWFSLVEVPRGNEVEGVALVFALQRGAASASCAALLDSGGKLEKIYPLSEYGERVFEDLPQPVALLYGQRIEKAARERRQKGD